MWTGIIVVSASGQTATAIAPGVFLTALVRRFKMTCRARMTSIHTALGRSPITRSSSSSAESFSLNLTWSFNMCHACART